MFFCLFLTIAILVELRRKLILEKPIQLLAEEVIASIYGIGRTTLSNSGNMVAGDKVGVRCVCVCVCVCVLSNSDKVGVRFVAVVYLCVFSLVLSWSVLHFKWPECMGVVS